MNVQQKIQKEDSMIMQKEMIAGHFENLARAAENGKKVVYTFVPGNLNELILAFDMLPVHPEVNALQSGMRKMSGDYIQEAEKFGHSEDVCAYVKCDIGMMKKGNIGPTGLPLPKPDLLLLSYTGCFTFLKWFEILKKEYDCPVVLLQVPYQAEGKITPEMRDYVTRQLEEVVVPALEKVSGKKFDRDRLKEMLALSAQAEDLLVEVWNSAKNKPSPIDAYFGGVFYIGPIFTAFRGLPECVDYYKALKAEVNYRIKNKLGPVTPEGELNDQKYRIVVEGPPSWPNFRDFWKILTDEGVVMVASTYTKVGGLFEDGFRHDPERPLESLGEYCMGCYTNHSLPARVDILEKYIKDFSADGFMIHSIKSCNSFSAGQLLIMRELEKRTGKAGVFIESDLVDPRYFSAANIKNRLESYFQMIETKRPGA
ncbi:MAG: benzoyl-CoA reductase subunit B [Proteobacteria bacterium]|nr:benzoyl-CoA reductase subunit B [Pseudomonadota bacterium]